MARVNLSIRERKIERGILVGPSYDTEVVSRGKDGYRVTANFMQGERFITGEGVTIGTERIANNSFGTILKIEPDEDREPTWTVRMDDGREFSFKPSEFIGYRPEDDKFKGVPKLALSDAMTYYASQGMTAKHNIELGLSAKGSASTYVGMTRHKTSLSVFIDGARHANALLSREGKTFTMSKTGATKQEDDEPEGEVTRAQILESYIAECERASGKKNACDFQGGRKSSTRTTVVGKSGIERKYR